MDELKTKIRHPQKENPLVPVARRSGDPRIQVFEKSIDARLNMGILEIAEDENNETNQAHNNPIPLVGRRPIQKDPPCPEYQEQDQDQ